MNLACSENSLCSQSLTDFNCDFNDSYHVHAFYKYFVYQFVATLGIAYSTWHRRKQHFWWMPFKESVTIESIAQRCIWRGKQNLNIYWVEVSHNLQRMIKCLLYLGILTAAMNTLSRVAIPIESTKPIGPQSMIIVW